MNEKIVVALCYGRWLIGRATPEPGQPMLLIEPCEWTPRVSIAEVGVIEVVHLLVPLPLSTSMRLGPEIPWAEAGPDLVHLYSGLIDGRDSKIIRLLPGSKTVGGPPR